MTTTEKPAPKPKAPRQTKPKAETDTGERAVKATKTDRNKIGPVTHEERLEQIAKQMAIVITAQNLHEKAKEKTALAKEQEKAAKAHWQMQYDHLCRIGGEEHELFKSTTRPSDGGDDAPARTPQVSDAEQVSITVLNLPGPIQQQVMDYQHDGQKITTLQHLRKFFTDGHILTDIKGIGPKAAEVIDEALRNYMDASTADASATTGAEG